MSGCRRASLPLCGLVVAAGTVLGTAPVVWAEPGADAVSAINDRFAAFGGEGSLLGAPSGDAVDVPGGAERPYAGGAIYYSKETGAHVMYGAILERYKALGGPAGSGLGFPKSDEADTGDGTGRFNDFSDPQGASIYWTPQWGASVIKGRVLEAWRQSGGVTGPFGYPSADTSVADGVQTGKFVGPAGTEIQWSQAAGLVTVPAALAEKIPGFGSATRPPTAEGTTSVTKPSLSGPATSTTTKSSKWWWIPVGIAGVALLAGLGRLLRRKPEPEPVRVAPVAEVKKPTTPPPTVTRAPEPPVPPRPAPVPPPSKVVPLAKTPPPARQAPTPPPPPPPAPPVPPVAPAPKAVVHTEADPDVAPVIRYESTTPAETTIRVTYENNAIGDDQKSVADKSDSVPDSQQL